MIGGGDWYRYLLYFNKSFLSTYLECVRFIIFVLNVQYVSKCTRFLKGFVLFCINFVNVQFLINLRLVLNVL